MLHFVEHQVQEHYTVAAVQCRRDGVHIHSRFRVSVSVPCEGRGINGLMLYMNQHIGVVPRVCIRRIVSHLSSSAYGRGSEFVFQRLRHAVVACVVSEVKVIDRVAAVGRAVVGGVCINARLREHGSPPRIAVAVADGVIYHFFPHRGHRQVQYLAAKCIGGERVGV